MYARWRAESVVDPEAATMRLRQARGDLFHDHAQSPLPASGRSRFTGLSYFSYDPAYRMRVVLEAADDTEGQPAAGDGSNPPGQPALTSGLTSAVGAGLHWPISLAAPAAIQAEPTIQLPASGEEPFAFRRIGRARLGGPLAGSSLSIFWMEGYAGGLFLPFRDATSGGETYGAGRYLLDSAKGADLGGDPDSGEIWLDFNLAYHPSCAYDPRWNCPLAPPENTLREAVRVGERLG